MTYVGSCVSLVRSILDALDVHDFASAAPGAVLLHQIVLDRHLSCSNDD